MGDLEEHFLHSFHQNHTYDGGTTIIFMFFLYLFIYVWTHGEDKLEEFIYQVNLLYNTIKFTHEFSKSNVSFLDVMVSLDNNNKISTYLFVKSTDTHQYLLNIFYHPSHI